MHSLTRFAHRSRLSRVCAVLILAVVVEACANAQQPPTGPHIYLQEPQDLQAIYSGAQTVASALASGQATPLSLTSGDFYEDGIASLIAGYAVPGGGALTVMRGNLDAFAPQSTQSWLAISQGRFPSPFFANAVVVQTPARPDFLAAGRFVGTDHTDLITAARGDSALYVLSGDGHGGFSTPQVVALDGKVTVLAAGEFGSPNKFTSLLVGINGPQPALLLYQGSEQGLSLIARYSLPAAATALAFSDLDGDSLSDAAIIAGGQVLILHSVMSTGTPALETISLPLSAEAIVLGYFVHDRGWRQQMAILSSDGSLSIVVHGGFDPRQWTQAELKTMRQAILQKKTNPYAPPPFTAIADGWKIIEIFPGVGNFTDPSSPPLMYRASIFDHSTHDVMIINGQAAQMVFISHPNTPLGATTMIPGQVSIRTYSAGQPIAGLPMRTNVDGRLGLAILHKGKVAASVMMPLPDPTFTVDTTADTVDVNPGDGICADAAGHCSLRAAVMEANASLGNDTIMVPAGTFTLTIPDNGLFNATGGHLDINDGVSIVGQGPNSTIIVGQAGTPTVDKVFTIGLFDPGFATAISNLTMQSGQAPASDPVGGAFDWDAGADGTGTLTLTNVTVANSSAIDPTLPGQDDGGGVFLSSEGAAPTSITMSGSTIQSNLAADGGGGLSMIGPISLTLTNTQILDNRAVGGGAQTGGGLQISFATASGSAQLHGVTIAGNIAGSAGTGNGGGVWSQEALTLDQGSVIHANQGGNAGGGIWSDVTNGAISVTATTLTGNSTAGDGGAIHVEGSGTNTFKMIFSRITGNSAAIGSGLHSTAGAVTATDNWWGCNEGPAPASNTTTPVNIFNTGTTSSGVLAADGSTDMHYSLVGSADSTSLGPGVVVANSNAFPIPPWMNNGPNSKWVAPLLNAGTNLNPGTYVYQTTFDLTGFNLSTVTLSGQWAADNSGVVDLNGVPVAGSSTSGFSSFAPFTISNGFINGVNTLDFLVSNLGSVPNPTGFRAEVSGAGTSTSACDLVVGTANASPWITLTHKPTTNPVTTGASTQLTATFLQDSAGSTLASGSLAVLIGLPVSFTNAVNGTLSNTQTTIQSTGTAMGTLTTTLGPLAHADAAVDNATASATVAVSDFSLFVSPPSQTVNVGGATAPVSYDVTVSTLAGFSGPVSLICTAPAGITATCSPTSITGGPGASSITVSISGSTTPGNYPITVQASSGAITHSTTVQLSVADFSISVTPSNINDVPGQPAIYTVTCSTSTGFNGPVQLSTAITGATTTFSGNPVNCPGQVGLTVTPNTTPTGPNPFTVTGASGNASRPGSAQLTVADFSISITTVKGVAELDSTTNSPATYTMQINGTPGFSVALSISGLPSGSCPSASGSFSPTVITGSGSSALTISIGCIVNGTDTIVPFTVTGTLQGLPLSRSVQSSVELFSQATDPNCLKCR